MAVRMLQAVRNVHKARIGRMIQARMAVAESTTKKRLICFKTYPIPPDPSKYLATGRGLKAAVVGKKSTVFLHAIDFDGEPCKKLISSLQCDLVSEVTGVVEKGNIEHKGRDQYEIDYQPTIKGKHQLSIKVEDTHISAVVAINSTSTPIRSIGLSRPEEVAINQKGEVVVVHDDCVSVFSPSGEKRLTFGSGQG